MMMASELLPFSSRWLRIQHVICLSSGKVTDSVGIGFSVSLLLLLLLQIHEQRGFVYTCFTDNPTYSHLPTAPLLSPKRLYKESCTAVVWFIQGSMNASANVFEPQPLLHIYLGENRFKNVLCDSV